VQEVISSYHIKNGLCNIFIQHTSASLIICENADLAVLQDLEYWLAKQIPENDPNYKHTMEGSDDMPSHIRSIITSPQITIPITNNKLALGTWQGIFLYEHRRGSFSRKIIITTIKNGY